MTNIDYYFFSISPFTYLGHQAIVDVAAKHGATLNIKPSNLMAIWEVSGAVPPPQRPPVRQRHRLLEIMRCADIRGLPINKTPAHFPVDASLADNSIIALVEMGEDPVGYMGDVFAAVWVNDQNISDETVLSGLLKKHGFDADAVLAKAKTEEIAAIRASNAQDAVDADAVGVPAYVVNGEVFWGQDRVEHIDHMLTSGREPFSVG